MKYNNYVKGCPKVSEIGFGGWQLGNSRAWDTISKAKSTKLIQKAVEKGINFFDTAPNYGGGESELILGRALKNTDRSKIVINTKYGHTVKGNSNFSSSYIRESLEGSLKRLRTDYVDSFLIHNPEEKYLDGNKTDHYEILEKLIEEGKILSYGASIDSTREVNTLLNTTNAKVLELMFNIIHQDIRHSFSLIDQKEVAVINKIPLDSGWLSGKYNSFSKFFDIRARWNSNDKKVRSQLVEEIKKITSEDKFLSKAALAFCLSYDQISTVIPGNKNITQLVSNIASTNYSLSAEIIKSLENFYNENIADKNIPW